MQEPAEPPEAVQGSDTDPVLFRWANEEPRDVVALLHALDQYLFAARLGAEAMDILAVTHPDDAQAALYFVFLQLDAAADTLSAFLLRDPPA